uniref:Uncharacterized protein n=1 Tax=Arundo donax TaxID=35708 RepID=A0A0A9FT89_ARUDO
MRNASNTHNHKQFLLTLGGLHVNSSRLLTSSVFQQMLDLYIYRLR